MATTGKVRNLNFVNKNQSSDREGDVYIRINGKGRLNGNISFRFESWEKITKGNYIQFAVSGNRMYFTESNATVGYKLGQEGKNQRIVKTADETTMGWILKNKGDYPLLYDTAEELYYIER